MLVRPRASQVNSCGYCVEMHSRDLKKAGESDERPWPVTAWREAIVRTPAERAALAPAEEAGACDRIGVAARFTPGT
ncbi:carboxymuconolactone decarboxylase family protein [Nonomuraea sp. B5E05]|uniref:carboxymuconolactone decarboxylase family protein n=1 Tax=Nonomuraea sp. B5E05 TaxID=3153569 RepID=UPI00326124FD